MQVFRGIHRMLVLAFVCLMVASGVLAQTTNSAQDQWNRLVAGGYVESLEGVQTVGNTTVTLLGGYADDRVIMIHFAVTGERPPLTMHEHTFTADNGVQAVPIGEFNVELGHVMAFRNPGSASGTLQSYVVSAETGYDSRTGEVLQGDGTEIGPFNLSVSLAQNTERRGSGSGVQSAAGVTMELQSFSITPSGATAVICHDHAGHFIQAGAVLTDGTVTSRMSSASLPYSNSAGQTCQDIAFMSNIGQLGASATLRIGHIANPGAWSGPDPERDTREAEQTVALLRERGYEAWLEEVPGRGYGIRTNGVPWEVFDAVRAEARGGIAGNWTFEVSLR